MKASVKEMPVKKIILVFPFDLLSHYLRCLVLVNIFFRKQEYDVVFLESPRYNEFIAKNGYRTFSCARFDADTVMRKAEKFDFSWLNAPDIDYILNSQVEAIQLLKADLIIGDASPSLRMAAELTGVKYISVVNGYMTPFYVFPRRLSRRHWVYPLLKILPGRISTALASFGEKLSMKQIHRPFAALRKRYRLQVVPNYLAELGGDQNLICDLPGLFPQKVLPANYMFVGPLMYKDPETFYTIPVDQARPVIFITMGSTGNWRKLEFLNGPEYRHLRLVTAGDSEKVLHAGHVTHFDFVDMEKALDNVDLMICHGGNGTIYYGLLKGVYMLCITSHFEQEWNVQALERLGYGRSADHYTTEDWSRQLGQAVQIKLKPFFKANDIEKCFHKDRVL